ncbi:MAG: TonB-dependent receptor [Bacteroidales bacterium]|nr:TonB-dependent receptor [Candidatus Cryptobacteroides fimicaballi]
MKLKVVVLVLSIFLSSSIILAQSRVKVALQEEDSGEAVAYATVTLSRPGAKSAQYAALSDEKGAAVFSGVKNGTYLLKAELLGYLPVTKEIKITGAVDLRILKMPQDAQAIDAAKVSAVGNPVIIKKDTIEYNASSFKVTDNDVLEDLLKKLPGVEVAEDGTITQNGETITKIMIDGKTFFLDDPQLASKNIPAKIIEKVKVIDKKSDQAEFTGIDDGEEEHVIDLTIQKGMMKGLFGNVMAGGGHDLASTNNNMDDWRYQGAGFVGRFTDKSQLSVILNANNTNNRGFNDLSASMMQGMRGGGRGTGGGTGNGITTSYMGGVNGGWNLFDNRMELGANYLYNHSDRNVESASSKTNFMTDGNYLVDSREHDRSASGGHRFGVRLKHEFSKNTSIIFQPQVNFGNGNYSQNDTSSTIFDNLSGKSYKMNDAFTNNTGSNKNVSTSGFLMFRQRLGIPGRTMTVTGRYNYSNNLLNGINNNSTTKYDEFGKVTDFQRVNQNFNSTGNSASLSGRITYTEPLGHNFYVEANYSYGWRKSVSDKNTYELETGLKVDDYSNRIVNESQNQEIGVNALYQSETVKGQLGFSAKPTKTHNETTKGAISKVYDDFRWNFSPTLMIRADMSESFNLRVNYRGNTSQPSTSQLMPVPDNTNPLSVTFGNPSLTPYFSHNINADIRFNDRSTFTSFNVRLNGSYVQNPIVNTTWYDGGSAYSMPVNGPASMSAGVNGFCNIPIARSGFSISNMLNMGWSRKSAYVGTDIDMSTYSSKGFYDFMEEFVQNFNDKAYFDEHIALNTTNTLNFTDRLRLTYRSDALEVILSGRTRMNSSWYTIAEEKNTTRTWNNNVMSSVNWTWDFAGLVMKTDVSYNWYEGYETPQRSMVVWNAELQKLLLKKTMTLALKCYDILGQQRNINVTDSGNYHLESESNSLGRYIVLSLTYRFGNFGRGGHGGPRGPGGPGGPGGHGRRG